MSVTRAILEVTAKLYYMRAVMRDSLGPRYNEHLAPFIEMYARSGRPPLDIASEVSTAAQKDGKDDIGILALVAAVEMLEPSK